MGNEEGIKGETGLKHTPRGRGGRAVQENRYSGEAQTQLLQAPVFKWELAVARSGSVTTPATVP